MKPNKKNEIKLNIKLLVAVLITLTVTVCSYLYVSKVRHTLEHSYQHGEIFTIQAERSIKMYVKKQIAISKYIANEGKIINVCIDPTSKEKRDEAGAYLKELNDLHPEYSSLHLVLISDREFEINEDGKLITIKNKTCLIDSRDGCIVGEDETRLNEEEQKFIEEIISGKPYYISRVQTDEVGGEPIFIISAPIIHENKIVGISVVSTLMDHIMDNYVGKFAYEDTGHLFILDDRTVMIAHKNKDWILKEAKSFSEEAHEASLRIIGGEEQFTANILGDRKVYVSKKMDLEGNYIENDWFAVYSQDLTEVNKELSSYMVLLLSIGSLIVIISIMLIKYLSQIFQKDIKKEKLKLANVQLEKEIKNRTKEIEKLSNLDGLTGIYNRETAYRKLMNIIEESKWRERDVIAIMVDVDHFKNVNDKYGHLNGDIVLIEFANLLKDSLRKDDIVGRYGGEEFILVMTDIEVKEAVDIIDRIRIELSIMEIQLSEGQSLKITASFGIVRWNGEDIIEFVRKADDMIYKAKENGRNRVEY